MHVTTQGIKYAGSKLQIIPSILSLIEPLPVKTVLDGFSGTTRVSQALAQRGYRVITNDVAVWSEVFARCYLTPKPPNDYYTSLLDHLNQLSPTHGWFSEHYGGVEHSDGRARGDDGLKKPWQIHNTRKLDAIREELVRLKLNKTDESVALTSLILALDKVDSTMGHFVSYLKEWSARSYKELHLELPHLFQVTEDHRIYRKSIFDLIPNLPPVDLAYLDPPYGSNNEKMPPSRVRYASYYHLWASVCLYDKPPLFGKALRRTDSKDRLAGSVFEEFRKDETGRFMALKAIEKMIVQTPARFIILSYSSGGRATAQELNELIGQTARLIKVVELDYRRNVMAGMRWTNEWLREAEEKNKEFLFLMEK